MGGNDRNKRYNRIEVRLNNEEREFIWTQSKKLKISVSDYIRCTSIQKPTTNDELYNVIIRKAKLSKAVNDAREKSFHLYFDKNAMRRIIEAAKFSQYHTGKVNMKEVQYIIKTFETIYAQFPDEIKEIKSQAFKIIQNCGNQNYLIEKLKITDKHLAQIENSHLKTIESTSNKNILEHVERKEQARRGYDKDGKKV